MNEHNNPFIKLIGINQLNNPHCPNDYNYPKNMFGNTDSNNYEPYHHNTSAGTDEIGRLYGKLLKLDFEDKDQHIKRFDKDSMNPFNRKGIVKKGRCKPNEQKETFANDGSINGRKIVNSTTISNEENPHKTRLELNKKNKMGVKKENIYTRYFVIKQPPEKLSIPSLFAIEFFLNSNNTDLTTFLTVKKNWPSKYVPKISKDSLLWTYLSFPLLRGKPPYDIATKGFLETQNPQEHNKNTPQLVDGYHEFQFQSLAKYFKKKTNEIGFGIQIQTINEEGRKNDQYFCEQTENDSREIYKSHNFYSTENHIYSNNIKSGISNEEKSIAQEVERFSESNKLKPGMRDWEHITSIHDKTLRHTIDFLKYRRSMHYIFKKCLAESGLVDNLIDVHGSPFTINDEIDQNNNFINKCDQEDLHMFLNQIIKIHDIQKQEERNIIKRLWKKNQKRYRYMFSVFSRHKILLAKNSKISSFHYLGSHFIFQNTMISNFNIPQSFAPYTILPNNVCIKPPKKVSKIIDSPPPQFYHNFSSKHLKNFYKSKKPSKTRNFEKFIKNLKKKFDKSPQIFDSKKLMKSIQKVSILCRAASIEITTLCKTRGILCNQITDLKTILEWLERNNFDNYQWHRILVEEDGETNGILKAFNIELNKLGYIINYEISLRENEKNENKDKDTTNKLMLPHIVDLSERNAAIWAQSFFEGLKIYGLRLLGDIEVELNKMTNTQKYIERKYLHLYFERLTLLSSV